MSGKTMKMTTKDGKPIEGKVVSVSHGNRDSSLLGHLALIGRITGRAGSVQLEYQGSFTSHVREGVTIPPPIPLDYYVSLYRNDPTQKACVNAKVACVTSQGYKIRPRREMALVDNSTTTSVDAGDAEPSVDEKKRLLQLLDSGLPDYPFLQILHELWLDVEVTGNGYLEFSRNGEGVIDGIYPVKSVTMQVLADNQGYMQSRAGKHRFFARYNPEAPNAVVVSGVKEAHSGQKGKPCQVIPVPREWGRFSDYERTMGKAIVRDISGIKEEGDQGLKNVNEVMMFRKPSPLDTPYGEPDVLSAAYDILGSESTALFNLNYFENATIPRLVIIVEGGQMSEQVEEQIRNWVSEQSSPDVLNQVLLVENPDPNTKIRIEPLGVSQLSDAGFLEYREHCDAHIMAANRTPPSILGMSVGESRAASVEANLRFIATVVRPDQRLIESRFNYIFENELGVTDWVLELSSPELVTPLERARFYDVLISRGIVTVNDVRRFFGLHPVDGGDEPFIQVVGQGAVPIKFIDRIVEANMNTSGNPNIATSGMQTPSDDAPITNLPQDAQGKALVNMGALSNQSDDDRDLTALLAEQVGVDAETVDIIRGSRVDSAVNRDLQ